MRPAAVALVVLPDAFGNAGVVLTRRPLDVPRHPGQYALPGGRLEPGETPVQAATRELEEEVGLALGSGDVLGLLDDFATRSGFLITPVVLWCPEPRVLVPDPREVAEVHHVALATLLGDIVHEDPGDDPARPILSLGLLGGRVFAPTAALLYQLRQVCLLERSTRVAHYEQPRFAWR